MSVKWLLLRQDSAPYLATILLGACGAGLLHLMDRLTEAPTVEYCVKWHGRCPRSVTVTIQNLSHSTLFRDLRFTLGSRSDSTGRGVFSSCSLVGEPPAFQHDTQPKITDDGSELEFLLADLQPGNLFILNTSYSGSDTPRLRLIPAASATFPTARSTEVRLLECSWLTHFIKHQFRFVLIFSLGSLIIVALLLYTSSSSRGR